MPILPLTGRRQPRPSQIPFGHIRALAFEGEGLISGLLAKAAEEAWYVLHDLDTGEREVVELPQRGRPWRIVPLDGGRVLTATGRQAVAAPCVALWSPRMRERLHQVDGKLLHLDPSSLRGWLAVDGALERWDLEAPERLDVVRAAPIEAALLAGQRPPTLIDGQARYAAASPDLQALAVLDLHAGSLCLEAEADFVVSRVKLAPEADALAATGFDGEVAIYDLSSGALLSTLPPRQVGLDDRCLRFVPGDAPRLLVPLADGALELWDYAERRLLQSWPADPDPNSGPIDVLTLTPIGGGLQLAVSHMNHRLKIGQIGQEGWQATWTGEHPVTACVGRQGLVVCGDQDGALAFIDTDAA